MSEFNVSEIKRFVNRYLEHETLHDPDVEPVIRFAVQGTEYTRKLALKSGKPKLAAKATLMRGVPPCTAETLDLDLLKAVSDVGSHLFYILNYAEPDEIYDDPHAWQSVADCNITRILYLPIDIDWDIRPHGDIEEVLAAAGIVPWMVIQTSDRDHPKYHVLIAVHPDDAEDLEGCRKAAKKLATVFGGDPSAVNASRKLRAAGGPNWKFEGGKVGRYDHAGVAVMVRGDWEQTDKYYRLKKIVGLAAEFAETELSQQLVEDSPERKPVERKARAEKGEKRTDSMWWEAGEGAAYHLPPEEVLGTDHIVPRGSRHRALNYFAGKLSMPVCRGKSTMKAAKNKLRRIAKENCPGHLEGYGDKALAAVHEKEFEARLGMMDSNVEKYESNREERMEHIKLTAGLRRVKESELPGKKEEAPKQPVEYHHKILAVGDEYHDHVLGVPDVVRDYPVVPDDDEKMQEREAALKKLEPGQVVERNAWIEFALRLYGGFKEAKWDDANVERIAKEIVARIGEKGGLMDIYFTMAVPRTKSAGGKEVHYVMVAGDLMAKTLLEDLVARLNQMVGKYSGEFAGRKEFAVDMRILRQEAQDKAGGDPVIEEALYQRKVWEFFSPKLTAQRKDRIVKKIMETLVSGRACGLENNTPVTAAEARLVYQNGALTMSEQDEPWEDGDLWRTTLATAHAKFRFDVAKGLKGYLNGKAEGWDRKKQGPKYDPDTVARILEEEVPIFYKWVSTTFPDDKPTWLLMCLIIAYCLSDSNPFQVFFQFLSTPNSGKTEFGKLIMGMAGANASVVMKYSQLGQEREGSVYLAGKNFAFIDEASSAGISDQQNEACVDLVKSATSGVPVPGRKNFGHSISFLVPAKLLFTGNNPLSFADDKGGFQRRAVALHFGKTFTGHIIENLALKVLREEVDALATICGVLLTDRWHKGRELFNVEGSKALGQGSSEVNRASMPELAFAKECLEVTNNEKDILPAVFIRKLFESWYGDEQNIDEQEFGRKLVAALELCGWLKLSDSRRVRGDDRAWFHFGVKLKDKLPVTITDALIEADNEVPGVCAWLRKGYGNIFSADFLAVGKRILTVE